jgi:hypothetical protein
VEETKNFILHSQVGLRPIVVFFIFQKKKWKTARTSSENEQLSSGTVSVEADPLRVFPPTPNSNPTVRS